jgi:hypothetical protein
MGGGNRNAYRNWKKRENKRRARQAAALAAALQEQWQIGHVAPIEQSRAPTEPEPTHSGLGGSCAIWKKRRGGKRRGRRNAKAAGQAAHQSEEEQMQSLNQEAKVVPSSDEDLNNPNASADGIAGKRDSTNSGGQQLVEVPRGKFQTPRELARALISSGVLTKADGHGRGGNSVMLLTLSPLLRQLSQPKIWGLTYRRQVYDEVISAISYGGADVTVQMPLGIETVPDHNMVVLLLNGSGHYSLIIVDVYDKEVHVFDTMSRSSNWWNQRIVEMMFPELPLLSPRIGFKLCNHTGNLHQSGLTCGPWSLWIAFAYAFNYGGCRTNLPSRLDYRALQVDPVEFWSEIVY